MATAKKKIEKVVAVDDKAAKKKALESAISQLERTYGKGAVIKM